MPKSQPDVTALLHAWTEGDESALPKLMPLVCQDLRDIARRYLRQEESGHTLQPTALVNEVYLRLRQRRTVNWKSRAHFFGFAAQQMRKILVDHARNRRAVKRGGADDPLPLDESLDLVVELDVDVVALDDALRSLEKMDPRQAQIVDLRFFVGLTVEETAAVLGISAPTVKREWKIAKLWLYRELSHR